MCVFVTFHKVHSMTAPGYYTRQRCRKFSSFRKQTCTELRYSHPITYIQNVLYCIWTKLENKFPSKGVLISSVVSNLSNYPYGTKLASNCFITTYSNPWAGKRQLKNSACLHRKILFRYERRDKLIIHPVLICLKFQQ